MANHPNRKRGASGATPLPLQIKTARGSMTQAHAASLIYTTGTRWSN